MIIKANTMVSLSIDHAVLAKWLSSKKFGCNGNYKDGLTCLSVGENFSEIKKVSKACTDEGIAEIKGFKLQNYYIGSLLTFCNNIVPLNFLSSIIFEKESLKKTISRSNALKKEIHH